MQLDSHLKTPMMIPVHDMRAHMHCMTSSLSIKWPLFYVIGTAIVTTGLKSCLELMHFNLFVERRVWKAG